MRVYAFANAAIKLKHILNRTGIARSTNQIEKKTQRKSDILREEKKSTEEIFCARALR